MGFPARSALVTMAACRQTTATMELDVGATAAIMAAAIYQLTARAVLAAR
jgi:fatty acid/phospholipid biosynthesis enzyme